LPDSGVAYCGISPNIIENKEFTLNLKAHFTPKIWIMTLL